MSSDLSSIAPDDPGIDPSPGEARFGPVNASRSEVVIVALILLAVGVFYVVTLRRGQNWGDDFAMYVMHARNIATGHSYAQTGYIYNPAVPGFGPRAYPPVFPLMLAPAIAIWGVHFLPMKIEIVLSFLAALWCSFALFRREIGRTAAISLVLLMGFNEFFWAFKDEVLSDIPFLFFLLLALYAMYRHEQDHPGSEGWRSGAWIGVTSWVAFGTRSVGIVLIPAFFAAELFAHRRVTRTAVVTLGTFLGFVVVQRFLFGGGAASYLDQFKPTLASVRVNLRAIPRETAAFWGDSRLHGMVAIASILLLGTAALGFLMRALRRITVLEIFPVFYLVAVLVWPSGHQGTRLLIPLIPLVLFFALSGVQWLARRIGRASRIVLVGSLTLVVLVTYASSFAVADFGPIPAGVTSPAAVRFFRFVDAQTPAHAVFVFYRPRALALFTGRSASVFEPAGTPAQNWRYFESIQAGYLALAPQDRGRAVMQRVVSAYRKNLIEVYRADSFRIYRIVSY